MFIDLDEKEKDHFDIVDFIESVIEPREAIQRS